MISFRRSDASKNVLKQVLSEKIGKLVIVILGSDFV